MIILIAVVVLAVFFQCGYALGVRHGSRRKPKEGPKGYEGEVRIYLTEREIGGVLYWDEICARSLEEAADVAKRMGGKVLGTLEQRECCTCELVTEVKPKLSLNEWPDEVDY